MILKPYLSEVDPVKETVIELLEEFKILPLVDSQVSKLSRSQTYKVALTALMAVDPDVWILDEPFASGMEPHGIAAFRRHAHEAAKRGRTIIYSTQLLELAEIFSNRVCIMAEGKIHTFDEMAHLRSATSVADGFVLEELFGRLQESPSRTRSPSFNNGFKRRSFPRRRETSEQC